MSYRLPSLNLLRSFEAAGRRSSFKRAAAELHVTPSAVSHQIKSLEDQLGFRLFQRGNRSLELTEAGRDYLAVVHKTFSRLREGTERVRRTYGEATLRISLAPPVARHVVLPRLRSFRERAPGLTLRIETAEALTDFKYEHVDLAVRYGAGDWPGLESEKLVDLTSTPVCTPDFAATHGLGGLEDLGGVPLI